MPLLSVCLLATTTNATDTTTTTDTTATDTITTDTTTTTKTIFYGGEFFTNNRTTLDIWYFTHLFSVIFPRTNHIHNQCICYSYYYYYCCCYYNNY